MFRVTLGLATATFFALAASPASAGCCGSNSGWGGGWGAGWGVNSSGCCNRGYAYQQAPVVYQQPQYYVQPAAPIVVQAPPQQIIVQQSQPEVIFQQAASYAPVPRYNVDHGPYYSGPETIGYSQPQYYADQPVRPYPYVNGYVNPNRYYGRPYRAWRHGVRPYRNYGVYKSYRPYRHAAYRAAVSPRVYVGPKKYWR